MNNQKHLVAEFAICLTNTAITTFGLAENIHFRNKLINACINFRHCTPKRALKSLFTLFYGSLSEREKLVNELFYNVNTVYLDGFSDKTTVNIPRFSEEEFHVLANELLYQYVEANPDFLELTDFSEYQAELESLKDVMANDPILFYRAVKQCELICHVDSIALDCINYLSSKQKTSNMQALTMLGHNFQHRVLLLPYSKQICTLLKAMHKAKNSPINRISPFEEWFNQHEEEEFINQSSTELPKILLLDELVNFSNLIRALPRSDELEHCLKNITFDKKLLLDTEEYQNLVKSIIVFLYKIQNYRESQADFSLGNTDSLYNFAKCRNAFESASALYNKALDNFLAYCKK